MDDLADIKKLIKVTNKNMKSYGSRLKYLKNRAYEFNESCMDFKQKTFHGWDFRPITAAHRN